MPRLGHYELRSVLGRGATGVVYEARSDAGERVAVKLLDAGFVLDDAARDRLRREARILCSLHDDHLVRVVEFVDDAEPYLVVEYVDGASLRAVLGQTSGLAPRDVISVMDDLLAGLGVAHAHQVIHRDIKPENVLVDRHGTAKLADFGLALSRRDASTPFRAGEGTPAYMSPEQVRGESLDARSDLYGVGCVLHELLTGAPPFVRDNAFAVMEAHTAADLPPMTDVPDALTAVTRRALQKDPAQRFGDADAFRAALDAAATRSYGAAVLAAGGALSGVVAGLASQTRRPKPSSARRLVRRVLSRPRLAPALAIVTSAAVVAGVATIALTRHSAAAAGWKPVFAASGPVRGVTCVRSACYAVGGTEGPDTVGVAATSTDGGRSWQPSRLPAGTGILRHVSCTSSTRCVAVGGVFGVQGRPPGEIVTTVDGGDHWQRNVVSAELSSVACVAMRCSAVGGGIFTSADGGGSWTAQDSTVCLDGSSSTPPPSGGLGCLAIGYFFTTHLVDERHGFAAGFNQCGGFGVTECPGGIARTDDGGRHWSLLASSQRGHVGDLPAVDAVTCLDRLRCRALASTFATSELLSTDDGGAHWKVSRTPLPQATDLSCRDATHCVATGFDTSRLHRPWLASFANGAWRRESLPSGVTGVGQLACTGSRCWIAATTTAPGRGRSEGAVLVGAPTR